MTTLLDGNVLVALAIDSHEFHAPAQRWFDSETGAFATCAVTEGTLLRMHMRLAMDRSAKAAWKVLEAIHRMEAHEFWSSVLSYCQVSPEALEGWSDVTDAWLAALARSRGGLLATLDVGLAAKYPDVGLLLP